MKNRKNSFINYEPGIEFAKHCRQSALEEGVLIINNIQSSELLDFMGLFGSIVPQHDGNNLFDVKPSNDLAKIYHSRTMNVVPAHTDGHDMPVPPHFFFLHCITPSSNGDGFTEVSDTESLLAQLSKEEYQILITENFNFETKPSTEISRMGSVMSPIYDDKNNIFRYSYNYLSSQSKTPEIKNLIEKINYFHEKNKKAVMLDSNQLLICENHHILHSRSSFTGLDRHLVRAWLN